MNEINEHLDKIALYVEIAAAIMLPVGTAIILAAMKYVLKSS